MLYIDEKQKRFATAVTSYPNWGYSTSATQECVWIFRNRQQTTKGDLITPTPWFNNTLGVTSLISQWQYRGAKVNGVDTLVLTEHKNKQPALPLEVSNSYFTVGSIAPNTKRVFSGDYNLSNIEALLKLNQQKVGISTMVAELSETIAYFASKALSAVRFVKAIKSGKYHSALKQVGITHQAFYLQLPKTVAARFLEWKFAILPLLHDMADVQAVLNSKLQELDSQLYIVAKGKHVHKAKQPLQSSLGTLQNYYSNSVGYDLVQTNRTKLYARIDDMELLVQKALGLESVAPAVWEMTPFSWLFDYVVNIGDVLQAYTAAKGLTFITGYNSTRLSGSTDLERYFSNYDGSFPSGSPHQNWDRSLTQCHYAVNGYTRSVLTSFPLPRLSYVLPDISGGHISNVIALVTGLVLGSKGFNKL